MIIKTFVEGPINANNYLIIDEDSRESVLIDCSSARPEFVQAIKNSDVKLKYILLTHGHFDHLLGVDKFKSEFGVDTYVSQDDLSQVKLAPDMMLMFAGEKIPDIGEITHFVRMEMNFQSEILKSKLFQLQVIREVECAILLATTFSRVIPYLEAV